MHAGHGDGRIDEAEQRAAHRAQRVVGPGDPRCQQVSGLTQDGAYKDKCHKGSDQNGQQRRGQIVQPGGRHLVQPFLNGCQNPGHRQHRQHGSLVADGRDLKSEDIPDRRLCHSDLVSVQQIGVDHNHTHRRAQKRVPAELLRGAEADQHGQERKRRVGKCIDCRGQPLPLGVKLNQGLPSD